MLSSDYREAYFADPGIATNPFYQYYFKSGDPFRVDGENPFTNPRLYWPYAVRLDVADWYLNAPTGLSAEVVFEGQQHVVVLGWSDHSGFEESFEVRREDDQGNVEVFSGAENVTSFTDYSVVPGAVYNYKVRARREGSPDPWFSLYSNQAEAAVVFSGLAPVTAYNSSAKTLTHDDDIHVTYYGQSPAGDERILYIHSSDRGATWGPVECVSPNDRCRLFPSLAVDAAGKPYIIWVDRWFWEGSYSDPRWHIFYRLAWKDDATGEWTSEPVAKIEGDELAPPWHEAPDLEPPQASFVIHGDSGFIAIATPHHSRVIQPGQGVHVHGFRLDSPAPAQVPQTLDTYYADGRRPTILADRHGRKVVVYGYGDQVRVKYREFAGQEWHTQDVDGNGSDPVCALTATLEHGINPLLVWAAVEAPFFSPLYYRRLVRVHLANYLAEPVEEIPGDMVGGEAGAAPKFAAGYSSKPLLLYAVPPHPDRVRYAYRLARESWLTGDVELCPMLAPSHPQGSVCGYDLFSFWTGAPYPGDEPPYFLVSKLEQPVELPKVAVPPVRADQATGPNNGRMMVVDPWSGIVHLVYGDGEQVWYAASDNQGMTWENISVVDSGDCPSICIDPAGMPAVAYLRDDMVFCATQVPGSGTWDAQVLYDGPYVPGKPSVVAAQAATGGLCYCAFPLDDPSSDYSGVWLAKRDPYQVFLQEVSKAPEYQSDEHVALACTPGDILHVAWQRGSAAVYTCGQVPPGWSEPVPFEAPVAVSSGPARHPFVEAYGEVVYCCWHDEQEDAVVQTSRIVYEPYSSWTQPEAVSDAGVGADYPICAEGGVTVWQQLNGTGVWEVWANVLGEYSNVSESQNFNSCYPHADAVVTTTASGTGGLEMLSGFWTEEVDPGGLYQPSFRRLDVVAADRVPEISPTNLVACGLEEASVYNLRRTGYRSSRGYRFDWDADSLVYELRYLNPRFQYVVEVSCIHDEPGVKNLELAVNGRCLARIRYGSARPETLRVALPPLRPGVTTLQLRATPCDSGPGAFAALSGVRLWACDRRGPTREGLQADDRDLRASRLHACHPNPTSGRTHIGYELAVPGWTKLRVYDATGRLVRSLVDAPQVAGRHSAIWDGRDRHGRNVANGIYFYRLELDDLVDGKKLVLSR